MLWFLIMQTGSALLSISSAALFWEAQERAADKGAWWTVSGLHLGRCQPCYLQHPFWLPSDTQCAEERKCSAPTLSVLRNVVSRGQDPREEAHQNRHCSLLSESGSLQYHQAPHSNLVYFDQTSRILISVMCVLHAQNGLKIQEYIFIK